MSDALLAKVAQLELVFRAIAATRMQGVPLLHPGLQVQAVGFAPEPEGAFVLGVLITPWFMNLLRLPLGAGSVLRPGEVGPLRMGVRRLRFIGADEAGIGAYEMCSLASPMFEFADQAAAVATAHEVLAQLRAVPPMPEQESARRRFLLGRGPNQPAAGAPL